MDGYLLVLTAGRDIRLRAVFRGNTEECVYGGLGATGWTLLRIRDGPRTNRYSYMPADEARRLHDVHAGQSPFLVLWVTSHSMIRGGKFLIAQHLAPDKMIMFSVSYRFYFIFVRWMLPETPTPCCYPLALLC
jgi:hypothetical protein